jgi:hypothetical protein
MEEEGDVLRLQLPPPKAEVSISNNKIPIVKVE